MLWQHYYQTSSLDHALQLLQQHAGNARIVAGGTDVLVELQRGVKPTTTLIDITALHELRYVRNQNGIIQIGGLATHNDVIASEACVRYALPLAQACWEVGAPQIRTRATLAGNLVTASPANDTIAPLLALDAEVVLLSVSGERVVALRDFYTGFRKTVIQPNELLREIRFPALQEHQRGLFIKLGLRRAQAISVIDLAIVLAFGDQRLQIRDDHTSAESPISNLQSLPITDARITLGCLAPTIVRAPTAEAYLRGKQLTPDVCAEAGRLACADASPIDDVRGSAAYRLITLKNLIGEGLRRIADGSERAGWPERPILLETLLDQGDKETGRQGDGEYESSALSTIATTINGEPYTLEGAQTKSLLDALRENAGLTGAKEGCAEGECGACTVWLNGQAVMACLVPAPQAQGGEIVTIEGLAGATDETGRQGDKQSMSSVLHPLQQAFIDNAAVQCGFCIPGMLMAGAKLLDEQAHPSLDQIQTALSGNICRCTGYRKILDAVLDASKSF